MKKKLFILAAVGCMALAMAGCGNSSSIESTTGSTTDSTQSSSGIGTINVNVSYGGMVAYAPEGAEIKFNEDFPVQSLQFSGAEGTKYVLEAKVDPSREGMQFVKWKKDGSDYSTDATITIIVSGNAEYYAVFEDPNAEIEGSYDYLVLVNERS